MILSREEHTFIRHWYGPSTSNSRLVAYGSTKRICDPLISLHSKIEVEYTFSLRRVAPGRVSSISSSLVITFVLATRSMAMVNRQKNSARKFCPSYIISFSVGSSSPFKIQYVSVLPNLGERDSRIMARSVSQGNTHSPNSETNWRHQSEISVGTLTGN